jgi:hypothetical protein
MANFLYDSAREGFLGGELDWDSTITVGLVRGYTPNQTTHSTLTDVTNAGGTVAYTSTLANKTKTAGVADGNNVSFNAVSGADIQHIIVYQQSNSRLIACLDSTYGVVLPMTPTGGDVEIVWDGGLNRIFRI